MQAMILAAGLGNRMQPLTANTPKPLLRVNDRALIEYHVYNLVAAGICRIVINHFYLGQQIEDLLGDGSRYGASIRYSRESERMETAGGIVKALPLLEGDSFVVVNADIWTDFPFAELSALDGESQLAHLVLVNTPEHNPGGDFSLDALGSVHDKTSPGGQCLTFSGVSVMHRRLFASVPLEPYPLLPVLERAIAAGKVTGQCYTGSWMDIGTPERLEELNDIVSNHLSD